MIEPQPKDSLKPTLHCLHSLWADLISDGFQRPDLAFPSWYFSQNRPPPHKTKTKTKQKTLLGSGPKAPVLRSPKALLSGSCLWGGRGSAVTHRRAAGRAGMCSLPHPAHLPVQAAPPGRASGGCFPCPCAGSASQLPRPRTVASHGLRGLGPNHWQRYTRTHQHLRSAPHPSFWEGDPAQRNFFPKHPPHTQYLPTPSPFQGAKPHTPMPTGAPPSLRIISTSMLSTSPPTAAPYGLGPRLQEQKVLHGKASACQVVPPHTPPPPQGSYWRLTRLTGPCSR
jgi:hypothetical protein